MHFVPPNQRDLSRVADLAQLFCETVEAHERLGQIGFLQAAHRLLPQVYNAVLALPPVASLDRDDISEEEEPEDFAPPDLEIVERDPDRATHQEWAVLHDGLGALIGNWRWYREIFDPYEPTTEVEVTADLADDLADIHRDLRAGLRKWIRGEFSEAHWEWRFHFEIHWGEHATGALRALHALASAEKLAWPPPDGAT